jgi:predicted HTH transcriptional regulator
MKSPLAPFIKGGWGDLGSGSYISYKGIEDPCSKLQGSSTVRNAVFFMIRSLTPPRAAGNELAFAVQRPETFLFPEGALREALLNAIVHKDYSSGVPIQTSVYDDKIVLWNPGQLPPGWTPERLFGNHPSNPPNPLLANAFFRAGYIESWRRGIEKIHQIKSCEVQAGCGAATSL